MRRIIILLFLVLGSAIVSCNSSVGNSRRPDVVVTVSKVDSSMISTLSREFVGVVKGAYTVSLSFGTAGVVNSVKVKEGNSVSKGDILVTLDERQARNAFNAAAASYERAKDGYERARQVYEKGSLPEVKWIEIQSQLEQAESLYDISLKNLEDCKLKAPCNGIVARRSVEPGMNVTPYTPVLDLMNSDGVELEIKVPENEIAGVRIGDDAVFSIPALGTDSYKASVISRGVVGDPLSHSYKVRLSVEGAVEDLLPGMVARVRMDGDKVAGVRIPGHAVRLSNDGLHYVWIVKEGIVFRKFVGIASIAKEGVIVGSGLSVGDLVVIDGVSKISEGMSVSVQNQ